jgi:N-acyl-D-aspartate/D-glutamate deacylase
MQSRAGTPAGAPALSIKLRSATTRISAKGGLVPDYDLIIKQGTIVDGTQVPRFVGDIGIRDGVVAEIGSLKKASADRVLDAQGLIVAPGFVDLHTHYDAQIQWDPYCTISGWHGVTSVVLGNCGFGFAPVQPEFRERAMLTMTRTEAIPYAAMKEGMLWDWVTFPEWLDSLDRMPKGVNCISYMPIAPLMTWVMGLEEAKKRDATDAETKEMQRLLNEAMDHGAHGFSIQRLGENSIQADFDGSPMVTDTMTDRLVLALGEVLAERGEGNIQITQFTGDIGRGVDTMVGHGAQNPDQAFESKLAAVSGRPILHNVIIPFDSVPEAHRQAVNWVEESNKRGEQIYGMTVTVRGPFTFTLEDWNLYDTAPAWNKALQGGVEERMANIGDAEIRQALIQDSDDGKLAEDVLGGPISGLIIEGVNGVADLLDLEGLTVGEAAEKRGQHPVETFLDLGIQTHMKAIFQTGNAISGSPEYLAEALASPYAIPGVSDGGAHTKFFTGGSYTTDFLTWLVRDTGKLTLEQAHYKLSCLPAHAAGFKNRGVLREGAPADVVVYDLENLKRVPEWGGEVAYDFPGDEWRRVQHAEGYRWIMVNGEITFEDGKCTGATPGKLLRGGKG